MKIIRVDFYRSSWNSSYDRYYVLYENKEIKMYFRGKEPQEVKDFENKYAPHRLVKNEQGKCVLRTELK